MAKWGAKEVIVGSANYPAKQPVVGEGLSHNHVASWYMLWARYRAEVGLMDNAVFDCRHMENIVAWVLEEDEREYVMKGLERVRSRVKQLQDAAVRRGRTVMIPCYAIKFWFYSALVIIGKFCRRELSVILLGILVGDDKHNVVGQHYDDKT